MRAGLADAMQKGTMLRSLPPCSAYPLWLMRHGQLAPNPQRRFIGQQDISLAAEGRAQMRRWQKEIQNLSLTALVTSDLTRCVESAALVLQGSNIPCIQEPALREISLGAWEGLTSAEVEARFPGAYAARGKALAHFRPQGGESFTDLAARVLPAVDRWHKELQGPVLFMAHAGVNRVILARHMALPLAALLSIPQPYASLTVL